MPSNRFAEALKLASELRDDERAALAEELWNTVPDELGPAWEEELRERVREMNAARAGGASLGRALGFDEMAQLVRGPDGDDCDE